MTPLQAPGRSGAYSAKLERSDKAAILAQDVAITASLCRLQCRDDLSTLGTELRGLGEGPIRTRLRHMRAMHPHMHAVSWVPAEGTGFDMNEVITEGQVDADLPSASQSWQEALQAAARGERYESEPLTGPEGDAYFVMSVPSGEAGGSLVALVHQDLLEQVASNQRRNLRLAEFPDEDKRFGIRAVDPTTGQEVDVDSPEENQGISHYKKREVVVKFKTPPTDAELERIKSHVQAKHVKKLGYAYVFDSESWTTKQLIDYFGSLSVEYAEPHYLYVTNAETTDFRPNDELYSRYQWNLPIIETPLGWSFTRGAEGVVVAVVDTGADLSHPDLVGHLTDGYNVVSPSSPPEDDVGHGTHVAGVISALTDNGQGVAGMTWYNKIMPVKVLDSTGMGSTYSVAEGIIWATDRGAKVINMSLGNYASAEFLHDAIRYAYDRDVVLIAATGNDNTSQPGFPAAYPEVLSVSATNMYGEKASFSNYGDYVDVVAPGENIASTYIDNQYAALSGTSMASPHVAALAALIRSANPELKNTEVYDIIRKTTNDLGSAGRDAYFGFGQINVAQALQQATGLSVPEAAADMESGEQTMDGGASWLDQLLRAIFQ
ncbi:S8 family peptidase [Paenibacillus sp. TRM 82003]|nr:S8 family peptidase [Paenibacillus sp. TRM 82003]